jgi:hypothetical protein
MEKNMLEILEERPNGIDPRLVQLFVYQLCLAIDYCHSQQIIHRGALLHSKLPCACMQLQKYCVRVAVTLFRFAGGPYLARLSCSV